jgi:anti-anti-sigma factor
LYGGEGFEAELVHLDGHAVVRVRGEVDLVARPELTAALNDALDKSPELVVDLSETTFFDASGLAAIVTAYERAKRRGGAVSVRSPSVMTRRVLEITGVDRLVAVENDT